MNSQIPAASSAKRSNYLPIIETVLLVTLFVGAILVAMQVDSTVLKAALLALGVVFYLRSNTPIDVPATEGERYGFKELLAHSIVPRTLWISSAVSAIGIAFYLFEFNGYKQMLIIGGSVIGFGALLLLIFLAQGVKHIKVVLPVLLRAIPLLMADLHLLYK